MKRKMFVINLNFKHRFPLVHLTKVKVPKEIEVPVFLIRRELQSRMFHKYLADIGMSESYFEGFLDHLILASLRLWTYDRDDVGEFYFNLMEKWSDDINPDYDVLTRRALKIHDALVEARDTNNFKFRRRRRKIKTTKLIRMRG